MSGSRAFCKSFLLLPSVTFSPLRFISLRRPKPSSNFVRMATEASSLNNNNDNSAATATDGDGGSTSHSAALSPSKNDYSTSSASSAIDFLSLCHRLKTTKRTGWVRREIQDPESIADHMYRMGIMALIASDIPGIDRDRCIKMAIVHDIAEAIVGDITPSDGVPKLEKSRREREALDYMCKQLGGGSRANEIGELWMEYEENSSPEAKIVKDFDKVEMILQALEYESEQGKVLDEFFQSTAGKFQTDIGKAWASEIVSRRRKEH
ncbi:5'-deoxynucleotidase HDDC2 isoform X2 [Macadamia integrifolia]|uniref:5'-deoxynucleotidase HDDC2 isoform X2 n=1 Tax=Macadamia integrifolia TaxID=60698 RepID=UPI001C4FA764|nr:5'-deoxynucleotidase HDDC2 isoform X2 [Macadamia integrifolia]